MLAVAIPAALVLIAAVASSRRGGPAEHGSPDPIDHGVPFAEGGRPIWPVDPRSSNPSKWVVSYKDTAGTWHGRASRAFKASRDERYHVGIDLFANGGDVVVAPESGIVVGRQPFLNGTGAMLVALDSGIVVLLGETKMGGAEEFGVDVGSHVQQGQALTRVGVTNAGSHMLHLETYGLGTTHNSPWYKNRPRPGNILDPTEWLLTARANSQAIAGDDRVA